MTAFEQTQPGFLSAFRTGLDRKEIESRIVAHAGFQSTFNDREDEKLQWSGTTVDGSFVEIWSELENGLFGLSISRGTPDLLARANAYFEIRKTIHELLEAKLVVTSVLQEILATFRAKRDFLELDGQDLSEIPPQIGMLTELEVLSLSNNRLTSLPAEIGLLSKLVELAVDENSLTELTPHIGRLTRLEILLLSRNRLRNLPVSIGDLANLRTLDLDYNRLRRLPPEIGKLAKLRRFSISDNCLTELPAEFAQLDGLQDFDWKKWESNPRKALPPRNVRNFIAYGNPWVHPPAEIMKKQVDVIRDYLKANPTDPRETAPYAVYVYDNYHPMDETYRYRLAAFSDCQSAIAACQKIVDEFFITRSVTHKKDMAQELFDSYRRFGEDPFILTSDQSCIFSAWRYAEQICQELATGSTKVGEYGLYRTTPPRVPDQPARKFVSSLVLADTNVAGLLGKLRPAFPELEWEGSDGSSGGIHLAGETTEKPSKVGVHLLCKDPPGPFTLTVRVEPTHTALAEADVLKARVEKALDCRSPASTKPNLGQSSVRYFIQQNSPRDPHPAVFRMRKAAGGTWQAHYWDRRIVDWQADEDIVRRYWNGFDPDVAEVSELEAQTRIKEISELGP